MCRVRRLWTQRLSHDPAASICSGLLPEKSSDNVTKYYNSMEVGMTASIMTRKGQVTIPKPIRDRLEVREGDKVFFVVRGDEVVLKVLHGTILDLKGSVKPSRSPEDFQNVRQAVKRARSPRGRKV